MKREWIPLSQWAEATKGLPEGQTIHVNHVACGDTRKRLYVTRRDEHQYLAFCHNCQGRSAHNGIRCIRERDADFEKFAVGTTLNGGWVPRRMIPYTPPSEAHFRKVLNIHNNWVFSTGHLARCHIYVDSAPVYVLEFLNQANEVYYGHHVSRDSMGTKKLVGGHVPGVNKPVSRAHIISGSNFVKYNSRCVIVEDRVSAALGAYNFPEYDWVALHGVHMLPTDYARIATYYDSALVWLDGDNDTVREKAAEHHSVLELLGMPKVRLAVNSDDWMLEPKKQDPKLVRSVLESKL